MLGHWNLDGRQVAIVLYKQLSRCFVSNLTTSGKCSLLWCCFLLRFWGITFTERFPNEVWLYVRCALTAYITHFLFILNKVCWQHIQEICLCSRKSSVCGLNLFGATEEVTIRLGLRFIIRGCVPISNRAVDQQRQDAYYETTWLHQKYSVPTCRSKLI